MQFTLPQGLRKMGLAVGRVSTRRSADVGLKPDRLSVGCEASAQGFQRGYAALHGLLLLACLCLGGLTGQPSSAAQSAVFDAAVAERSGVSLSLQASFVPADEHIGQPISIFVLALVPQGDGSSQALSKTPDGWQVATPASVLPWQQGVAATSRHTLDVVQIADVTRLLGSSVYLGYGLDRQPGVSAFDEMLRQQRYRLIYTLSDAPWALHASNEAALSAYLRQALGPQSTGYALLSAGADVVLPAPPPVSTGATAAVFSGTTLQETGVDEADLVKTDGVFVYSLDVADATASRRNLVHRQRLQVSNAALTEVQRLPIGFGSDISGSGFYLDSERSQLLMLGQSSAASAVADAWFAPQTWSQGSTELVVLDSSDAAALRLRHHLRLSGQMIGSRRIGATLYVVLRSYPAPPGFDPWWNPNNAATNQALLAVASAAQLLPTLSLDGGRAQPLVSAESCLTQADNAVPSADLITVVGFDLSSAAERFEARCFAGGTEAFYMSEQSLYLATTRNAYRLQGGFASYPMQTSTDIHKFALDGLRISYQGSGNVNGHLGFDQNRKSFRMGEYNGALRVITQTASGWGGWITPLASSAATSESPGQLSVLQVRAGALVQVGSLPNAARPAPLGKAGEQLYASRFIGARGYLVTYRLTDPLYVLDLSDPSDPRIAGQLEVSGYSDYLFPLTETLLLGVGKEAISDGSTGDGRFAWYQGVKLSLIDLSNPAQPREAARSLIGRRGTDATVLHDHHGIALQRFGQTVRVGLPVSLHDTAPSFAYGSAANTYYDFTRTELQRFEVTLEVPGLTAKSALPSSQTGQRDISHDRALLWNEQVHYYQDGAWRSADW